MKTNNPTPFEQAAAKQRPNNIVSEFWDFVRCNKKWWLLPILFAILLLSVFALLSGTAATPFLYTLF